MANTEEERLRLDIRIVDIKDRNFIKDGDSDSDSYMPINESYNTFADLLDVNSPTFDNSSEVDFSNVDFKMDRTLFRPSVDPD